MRASRALLSLLVFALAACSGEAVDQDGGDLTRKEVEYLSRNMSQAIENKYPLLKHQLVNRYVDSLGQYLVSHNPDMPPLAYEFRVLKTNEVNIFSLPGGVVYVTLGALRVAEIEGQFASAIANELAHQQLNHPLVFWRKRVNARRGQPYKLDFTGDFNDVFLGPDGAFNYGEAMQKEADELAPVILYRAQFDPRAYSSYLQLLQRLQNKDPDRIAGILLVHPPIERRMEWVKDQLVKLPPFQGQRLSTQSFDEIKQILNNAELRGKEK